MIGRIGGDNVQLGDVVRILPSGRSTRIALIVTFGVAFAFTQDARVSAAITGAEIVSKIALYYLHEQLWTRFHIGFETSDAPRDDRKA